MPIFKKSKLAKWWQILGRKYCPECGSNLSSIVLLSNFDIPNEFRSSVYHCNKCSKSSEKLVLVCMSLTKLVELKKKGKFPSAVKYSEKLADYLHTKNQLFLHDDTIPKKLCPECKEALHYDSSASNMKSDVKVRTYFHFDCRNSNQRQLMFFFVKQQVENMIINRVIIG